MRDFGVHFIWDLCINDYKLDWLPLKPKKSAVVWNLYDQVKRIRVKAAYDAKKAAKEGNKSRMTQRNALAKEGEPFINLLIYFSTPFNLFS